MADNVYNLKFTLSNGDVIDAGQITAPQGPKGDKGDSADIPYSSSTPFMDGVGSVGSANTVARGDHRHPSDTSRQEKLVSGTNIKTINGQSVLGSGDIPISGGSEYANTSEIVDNAITLTSTSTLADLATQILAQKTKVVRMDWDENLQRIMPPIRPSVGTYSSRVEFKVISTSKTNDIFNPLCGLIEVFYNSVTELKNTSLLRKYIIDQGRISNNKHIFSQTQWERVGNPSPLVDEIVITTDNVSPAINYGGTWEQIKDVFLLAAGDTYTAGSTGGEATHTHSLNSTTAKANIYSTDANGQKLIFEETSGGSDEFTATVQIATTYAASTISRTNGVKLSGNTVEANNLPPYLTVYMWKRIA